MSTAGVSNPIYVPYVWVNPATEKAELGTYSYAALMEQFQKKMEEAAGKPLEIGDQRLSEAEIQELANRYDPQNMTQDEYDGFIRYLQEKGVLSQLETSDLGMSRITIVPGYFEPAYIWTSSSGVGSSVRTLGDVGGNALQFAQLMSKWAVPDSSVQIRQGAYSKVFKILSQMNAVRGSAVSGQTSSACENGSGSFLSAFSPGKNRGGSTTSPLMMDLSGIQLTVDRIKSERIQAV